MIHSQVSPEKANVLPGGTAKVTLGRMSRHVDSKANCFCIYINFMISETKKYGIIYIYIHNQARLIIPEGKRYISACCLLLLHSQCVSFPGMRSLALRLSVMLKLTGLIPWNAHLLGSAAN
jgi:hypothetical protein